MDGWGPRSASVAFMTLAILGIGATARSATDLRRVAMAPTITLKRIRGTVFVRAPDSTTFASFSGSRPVPVGTEVDASNGRISITASSGQHGDFYQGRFVILVPPSQPNVIELDLSGSSFKNCRQSRALAFAQNPSAPTSLGTREGQVLDTRPLQRDLGARNDLADVGQLRRDRRTSDDRDDPRRRSAAQQASPDP
jgi:hypothetical protein